MATIKERAHQYATKKAGGWYTEGFKGSIWQASYYTYTEIATEQRKIDIENVRRFLMDNCMGTTFTSYDLERLIKAMEE